MTSDQLGAPLPKFSDIDIFIDNKNGDLVVIGQEFVRSSAHFFFLEATREDGAKAWQEIRVEKLGLILDEKKALISYPA